MSVVIPLHTSSAGNIPIQLQPYINIRQWNTIILNLNDVVRNGRTILCLGECACCLITGFWCIFCCHPCIEGATLPAMLNSKCNSLNQTEFGGLRVVQVRGMPDGELGGVQIIFDITVLGGNINAAPVIAAAYAVQETPIASTYPAPIYLPSGQSGAQIQPIPVKDVDAYSTAHPVPPQMEQQQQHYQHHQDHAQVRSMLIHVPDDAQGGSTLTVQAPDNTIVQVTLPPNAKPGETITVQY